MPKTKEREVGKQLLKRHSGKSGVRHQDGTLSVEYDCAVIRAKQNFALYGGEDLQSAHTREDVARVLSRQIDECRFSLDEDDKHFVAKATSFLKLYNLHKLK